MTRRMDRTRFPNNHTPHWALFLLILFSPCDTCITTALRLNKVFFQKYSRRAADKLIAQNRVCVNGTVASLGTQVTPYDIVTLDRAVYHWQDEGGTFSNNGRSQRKNKQNKKVYWKLWKPIGITSTTDPQTKGNLLECLQQYALSNTQKNLLGQQNRVFNVGRLDKDSSGLLLLTNDGTVPNAVLSRQNKRPKTYLVTTDRRLSDAHLTMLRRGLSITTDVVRNKKHTSWTAPTLPCRIVRVPGKKNTIQMTLTEGRNRQIRVMCATLGYTVTKLHRVEFLGIGLEGLSGPGDWKPLAPHELELLTAAVERAVDQPEQTKTNKHTKK